MSVEALISHLSLNYDIEYVTKKLIQNMNSDKLTKDWISYLNCYDRKAYSSVPRDFINYIEVRGLQPYLLSSAQKIGDMTLLDLIKKAYPNIQPKNRLTLEDYAPRKECSREYLIQELKTPGIFNEKVSVKILRLAEMFGHPELIKSIKQEINKCNGINDGLPRIFIQLIENFGLENVLAQLKTNDPQLDFFIKFHCE
jgi:superfamily I DNA/RNA helicase